MHRPSSPPALVAISLGFVLICELIGTCLLAHRAAVGRMAIIERHIVFGRKLPLVRASDVRRAGR